MRDELEKWDARVGGIVPRPTLAEYAPKYRDHFVLERHDGILQVRMHTEGGPALFSLGLHHAWGRLWQDVGSDPDNEVLILTGTGDRWIAGVDPASFDQPVHTWPADVAYQHYYDGMKLLENLVFGIDIPTIGALNGPGIRKEAALLCDLTLCTEETTFADGNFTAGQAPGDGMHLALQELLGAKRAAYYLYTGDHIDATTARELGLVNEVLPADRLLPRAQQIAEQCHPHMDQIRWHGISMRRTPVGQPRRRSCYCLTRHGWVRYVSRRGGAGRDYAGRVHPCWPKPAKIHSRPESHPSRLGSCCAVAGVRA
jgi:enoyl-CoA hydratase/carnithine racemase